MKKVAFITGGSKGIGYGIAQSLLEEGGSVAITSRNIKAVQEAVISLKEITGNDNIIGLEADVRDMKSQQEAIKAVMDHWGKIDIVIANAGVGYFANIEDMTSDQWNNTIDTNVTGVFNTIKASLDALKHSKGYFITISSLAGTNFFANGAAYNASKFAVTGFTQAVMLDLRHHGIRVATIMPGSVATHFNGHEPSSSDAWKIQIEDIGEMVVNLVKLNSRTLPSKIEVRPSQPPSK